ncbi:MAG: ABC transporter substrate-binding protein [bacterium]|nr:ABC transporter substrate-binding protein [bacterium]
MKFLYKLVVIVMLFAALWVPSIEAAQKLTLILDWFPNVDHLPIYAAREQGLFAEEGLEIKIISPSGTADGLKMAASGNMDIAVSYEPQTIIAAARGLDVMVFARLIGHPLTTLLFLKDRGIESPRDLSGKKIGYTVPGLMDVLLDAFARVNHIQNYRSINVGFAIVQSLTANKVDAVMGPFKTYETVTMAHKGYDVGFFELEKWGIPDYDELIFITSQKTMQKKQAAMAGFRRVMGRSIARVRQNPLQAFEDYLKQVPEADRKIESDAFTLTLPYYAAGQQLDIKRWRLFADFALKYGLIDKKVDVADVLWTK